MRFSQRIGKSPVKNTLEKEGISIELRNSLWTLFLEYLVGGKSSDRPYDSKYSPKTVFFRKLWIDFYKYPIDNLPMGYYGQVDEGRALEYVRSWFYGADWAAVLDFVEFCVGSNITIINYHNKVFKEEMSAYRFVDGNLVEINSKEEIIEIEDAIKNTDRFVSVKTHIRRALELYADKRNPDYRNSIKESISAVEALAKIIVNDEKTTLGKALNLIESKHSIPNSLKSAFSSLYGYTSDAGGIRHALLENGVVIEIEEARFMLIACSAFINYLISKT